MVQRIIGGKRLGAVDPSGKPPKRAAAALAVRRVVIDEGSEGQRLDNFLVKLLKGVPKTHVYRVIGPQGPIRHVLLSAVRRGPLGATLNS